MTDKPKPFPVQVLPKFMARFVREASSSIGCDPSYVALPLMASLGRAIGNKRVVRLKAGWTEPPIIWAAIISDSGEHKSPSQTAATQFLSARQNKERDNGGDVTYISTDATTAGVRDAVQGQPDTSLLIMPDELVEVFSSLGRAGHAAPKKGQWMSWWSAGELRTLRYNKRIHVPRVSVSIVGGIQPKVFKDAVLKERNLSDGLCARFLLTWQPDTKPQKWSKQSISLAAKSEVRSVFNRLLDMQTNKFEATYCKPDIVKLSETAEQMWAKFHDQHTAEAHLLDHDLKAAWGKLLAYAARFALIFQFAIWASDEEKQLEGDDLQISGLAMQKAIRLTEWFKGEARRIYQLFGESDKDSERRDLVTTIQRRGGSITSRELMRSSWKHKTVNSADAALTELVRAKLAKWEEIPSTRKGGRPTKKCVLLNEPKPAKKKRLAKPKAKRKTARKKVAS